VDKVNELVSAKDKGRVNMQVELTGIFPKEGQVKHSMEPFIMEVKVGTHLVEDQGNHRMEMAEDMAWEACPMDKDQAREATAEGMVLAMEVVEYPTWPRFNCHKT